MSRETVNTEFNWYGYQTIKMKVRKIMIFFFFFILSYPMYFLILLTSQEILYFLGFNDPKQDLKQSSVIPRIDRIDQARKEILDLHQHDWRRFITTSWSILYHSCIYPRLFHCYNKRLKSHGVMLSVKLWQLIEIILIKLYDI